MAGPAVEARAVGAVIRDQNGRIFVQRRSAARSFLPGVWDIVGGRVESGESDLEALAREIREETGWTLAEVLVELGTWSWADAAGTTWTEVDFLVLVAGDLTDPRLEAGKHDEPRWIDETETDLLLRNRATGDVGLHTVVSVAFARIRALRTDQAHHRPEGSP